MTRHKGTPLYSLVSSFMKISSRCPLPGHDPGARGQRIIFPDTRIEVTVRLSLLFVCTVTVTDSTRLEMVSFQVLRRLCLFAVTKPVCHGRVISACGLKTSTVNHSDGQPDPGKAAGRRGTYILNQNRWIYLFFCFFADKINRVFYFILGRYNNFYRPYFSESAMSGKEPFIIGTLDFGPIANNLYLINNHTSKHSIF